MLMHQIILIIKAGTSGPRAAIDLIEKDGRQWWNTASD